MSQPWDIWIAEHGPQLVLFARRWARDRSEAEDMVQEAFVRFWKQHENVREPLTYLYRCVRNVANDVARSRGAERRREVDHAAVTAETTQFACRFDQEDRRREIEVALNQLPVKQAEVVTLKIWSKLTFDQIAKVTDTAPGTVASRYRYALKQLQTILAESQAK